MNNKLDQHTHQGLNVDFFLPFLSSIYTHQHTPSMAAFMFFFWDSKRTIRSIAVGIVFSFCLVKNGINKMLMNCYILDIVPYDTNPYFKNHNI